MAMRPLGHREGKDYLAGRVGRLKDTALRADVLAIARVLRTSQGVLTLLGSATDRAYSLSLGSATGLAYSLCSGPADLSELTSPAWSLRDSWVLDCFTAFAMTTEEPTGWV